MDSLKNRLNIAEDRNGELKYWFHEITHTGAQKRYEREANRYGI